MRYAATSAAALAVRATAPCSVAAGFSVRARTLRILARTVWV